MRLTNVLLLWYRSVDFLDFEVGPFTVLFGKNNAGKTNILEAIYGVLAPTDLPGHLGETVAPGVRGSDDLLPPVGAINVLLEPGRPFDDEILALDLGHETRLVGEQVVLDLHPLPAGQVAFFGYFDKPGMVGFDLREYLGQLKALTHDQELDGSLQFVAVSAPRPRPLFLDWEFQDINQRVTAAVAASLSGPIFSTNKNWLEVVDADAGTWHVRPAIKGAIAEFCSLATAFLPDFIDGSVLAHFEVPSEWEATPEVRVYFEERDRQPTDCVGDVGRGAARWIAASIQIALHVLKHKSDVAGGSCSGHVLFVDEPEAHLHPSAVASIVRWCQKMVGLGFNVMVASHHEEFLRASSEGQTLVHVTRNPESSRTIATTLPSLTTTRLLELAADIGMHPASALSIRRAILFVEGPLDEAVLDEYAGLELDTAGVKVIPIHGTRNLEGLVAVELVTDLGVKTGILTDATDPVTMLERSKNKRSSEEKKVIEVMRIAGEKGLPPPLIFGVPEDDLLFALPPEAIRNYLNGPFPGWKELVAECREKLGKTPSESVDWKAYAEEQYGLRITTPGGVREVVRALDLASVPLPAIRTAIDQIVEWANPKI